jgi:hypothetical protein
MLVDAGATAEDPTVSMVLRTRRLKRCPRKASACNGFERKPTIVFGKQPNNKRLFSGLGDPALFILKIKSEALSHHQPKLYE